MQSAEVELVACLRRSTLRLKYLTHLRARDILPTDIPARIEAHVDGVPVMECTYGIRNGQYALRVERMLNREPEGPAGGSHA